MSARTTPTEQNASNGHQSNGHSEKAAAPKAKVKAAQPPAIRATTLTVPLATLGEDLAPIGQSATAIQALDPKIPASEDNPHTGNLTSEQAQGMVVLVGVTEARPELFAVEQEDGTFVQFDSAAAQADLDRWKELDAADQALDALKAVVGPSKRALGRRIRANMNAPYDRAKSIAKTDPVMKQRLNPVKQVYAPGAETKAVNTRRADESQARLDKLTAQAQRDIDRSAKTQARLQKEQQKQAQQKTPPKK